MKKSKKALLWTIVPVLGVSSGVAGAVAGVTSQKTSVDTNNVATSTSATTMATRSTSKANGLKIDIQPVDKIAFSGDTTPVSMSVYVKKTAQTSKLRYVWKVNKGDGNWNVCLSSRERGYLPIDNIPETNELKTWIYRCEITNETTNEKIVSRDAKLTIAPKEGRYINITQPEANIIASGGEQVTLTTKARGIGGSYATKEVGYQWFEYDSESNKYTLIPGANKSTYTFTAPFTSKTQAKTYVCRYYFTDNSSKFLSESNQAVVTINESKEEEEITIKKLEATKTSIEVGGSTTLSVVATSNITKELTYQWYKVGKDDHTFEMIAGATSSTYEYTATDADNNKELIFCVLVGGSVKDNIKYHFQSDNLRVKVGLSSETAGSIGSETLASKLEVSSSVTTNQASVRSTFYPVNGIRTPQYTVNVKGVESVTGLTYKWYYVGQGKKEHLIKESSSNILTTDKSLYEKVYKDNSNHKVGIVCRIYNGEQLIGTVDQSTDSRFYMTVVITRR